MTTSLQASTGSGNQVTEPLKVSKVTATLGNMRAVLTRVKELEDSGQLPADGKITLLTDEQAKKTLYDLSILPDKPDCTYAGYATQVLKKGLEELGISERVKHQMLSEITKKHGAKAFWGIGSLLFSQEELAMEAASEKIGKAAPIVAKVGFLFEVLKDVENVIQGGREAYDDHHRRCTLHEGSVGLTNTAAKEVIGTLEYSNPSPKHVNPPQIAQKTEHKIVVNQQDSKPSLKKIEEVSQKIVVPSKPSQAIVPVGKPPINLLPAIPKPMPPKQAEPAGIFSKAFAADIERAADKVYGYLEGAFIDATGVPAAARDIKDFKNMICLILENPADAPLSIAKKLIAKPEAILKGFVEAPKTALTSIQNFIATPGFEAAFGVVASALAVVSVVAAIFPLLDLANRAFQDPLKAPVIIVKELVNMGVGTVNAVAKLGKDLIRNPIKTGEHLFKSIIKAPGHAVKRIERGIKHNILGKRKKRKPIVYPKQVTPMDPQVLVKQFVHAAADCFIIAQGKWMVLEEKPFDLYLKHLYHDWKTAQANRTFTADLISFVGVVQNELVKENLSAVRKYTQTAHASESLAPWIVVKSHVDVGMAHAGVQAAMAKREVEVKQLVTSATELKKEGDKLDISSKAMNQLIDTKRADIIAGMRARKLALENANKTK